MDTREFFIEFTLRNACVTIFNDRYTQFRPWFTSLDDEIDAVVHGFTEYTQGCACPRPTFQNAVPSAIPRHTQSIHSLRARPRLCAHHCVPLVA